MRNAAELDTGMFAKSIVDISSEDGYLGDYQYLAAMLRMLWYDAIQAFKSGGIDAIEKVAASVADKLLGKDARVRTTTFNTPGRIDEFLQKWCGVGDANTPEERVTGAMLAFVRDCFEVAQYAAQPGVGADQWQPQIDGLVEQYAYLCMGLSLSDQAKMFDPYYSDHPIGTEWRE
jgi:hypothetical protein